MLTMISFVSHDLSLSYDMYILGRYPVYNGYPKSIVDWQIKEREKILAMNHEVLSL